MHRGLLAVSEEQEQHIELKRTQKLEVLQMESKEQLRAMMRNEFSKLAWMSDSLCGTKAMHQGLIY